jgi:hypothetical protein
MVPKPLLDLPVVALEVELEAALEVEAYLLTEEMEALRLRLRVDSRDLIQVVGAKVRMLLLRLRVDHPVAMVHQMILLL